MCHAALWASVRADPTGSVSAGANAARAWRAHVDLAVRAAVDFSANRISAARLDAARLDAGRCDPDRRDVGRREPSGGHVRRGLEPETRGDEDDRDFSDDCSQGPDKTDLRDGYGGDRRAAHIE